MQLLVCFACAISSLTFLQMLTLTPTNCSTITTRDALQETETQEISTISPATEKGQVCQKGFKIDSSRPRWEERVGGIGALPSLAPTHHVQVIDGWATYGVWGLQ